MESWHVVGQKVVCITDNWNNPRKVDVPQSEHVYTIRTVSLGQTHDGVFLRLKEIVNPFIDFPDGFDEPNFDAVGFRPVRNTSIECFRSLLNPTPDQIRELTKDPAHV